MEVQAPNRAYYPIDLFPTVGGVCPSHVVCVGQADSVNYILYHGPLVISNSMLELPEYINVFDNNVVCVGTLEIFDQEAVFHIVENIIAMRNASVNVDCTGTP